MIISIGGSVTTGSTPWIDIVSAYKEVQVLDKELRIGESGLYTIASKVYMEEVPPKNEFLKVKKTLLEFGQKIPLYNRLAFALFIRLPGVPADTINRISEYRLRKRSYDKSLPGFSLHSKRMLKELETLIKELNHLKGAAYQKKIKELMNKYVSSLGDCVCNDKKIVFDQLVAPRLLFDKQYGCVISDVLSEIKIIVVRRDPRDQFIDLMLKKKKGYHKMKPCEAASCYVNEYLTRYDLMADMLKKNDRSNVIDLWFEDIFFDFESALDKLEGFTGLTKRPNFSNCFDFSDASRKVKMYEENRFSKEIEFIEKHMESHLYRY